MKGDLPRIPYSFRALVEKLVAASNVGEIRSAARELSKLLLQFDRDPERAWGDCILVALRDACFDKERAAVLLGIEVRSLYRHINELELHPRIARAAAKAGRAITTGRPPPALLEARARRARASVVASRVTIGTIHAGYLQPNGETGFFVRPRPVDGAVVDSIDCPVVMLEETVEPGGVPQDVFEVVPAVVSSGWLIASDGDGAELPDPGLD